MSAATGARYSVALLIESSNAYARGILEGVIDFQRKHDAWSVFLPEQERGAAPPSWLKRWSGDGMIARIETETIARSVRSMNIPTIDVSAARRLEGIPWIETDDKMVASLAVEHLVERGFRKLAFCGDASFNWSRWRGEAFAQIVRAKGLEYFEYSSQDRYALGYSWPRDQKRLAKWIADLPKPIGLMASYDIRAQEILDCCRELNVAVPDQVAVVGVDNDPIICNLAFPSLTSVIPDAVQAGYLAAELLQRMMQGETIPADAHLLPPLGIATRQSTDVLAVDDPEVAAAAKYIRDHARDGITVADVLKHVPLSRRALESRFKKITGKTPHDAIVSQRLSLVERLLSETDLSLDAIAARTGFEHAEYMSVVFRQKHGTPPGKFRKQRAK